jgi:hypothetical protein
MKYLVLATVSDTAFLGKFANGATTRSHEVACFFVTMEDKGIAPAALESYIRMGELVDPGQDWKEIRRIASTFTERAAA